jgi:hypothetical protein
MAMRDPARIKTCGHIIRRKILLDLLKDIHEPENSIGRPSPRIAKVLDRIERPVTKGIGVDQEDALG